MKNKKTKRFFTTTDRHQVATLYRRQLIRVKGGVSTGIEVQPPPRD